MDILAINGNDDDNNNNNNNNNNTVGIKHAGSERG